MASTHSIYFRSGFNLLPDQAPQLDRWRLEIVSWPDRYVARLDAPSDSAAPLRVVGVRHRAHQGEPGYAELHAAYWGGVAEMVKAATWLLAHYGLEVG